MEKKWYQSSTLWLNFAGIVAMVIELAVNSNLIPDPEVVGILVGILNILNRFRVKPNEKVGAIEKSVV